MTTRSARPSTSHWASGLLLGATGLLLLGAGPARAALVDVFWTFTVVYVDAPLAGFQVGDQYSVELTIDDQVVDTNDSVGAGSFPGLVTDFSAAAGEDNVGTWDPGAGAYLAANSNFVTNAFGNSFTFQVRGTGFPDAGFPFQDFDLAPEWPPGIADSGLGDPFATQLGVAPGALALSDVPVVGSIRFQDGEDFLLVAVTAPEPAGAAAGGVALLTLALSTALRRPPRGSRGFAIASRLGP